MLNYTHFMIFIYKNTLQKWATVIDYQVTINYYTIDLCLH